MNDELQKALATILNKTTQGVEAGVDFLQRELPEVIQQLLVWHGVKSGLFFLLSTICTALLAWATKRLWQWSVAEDNDMQPFALFPAFGAGLFVFITIHQLDWLQILLAPKLYLVEYAASLAK